MVSPLGEAIRLKISTLVITLIYTVCARGNHYDNQITCYSNRFIAGNKSVQFDGKTCVGFSNRLTYVPPSPRMLNACEIIGIVSHSTPVVRHSARNRRFFSYNTILLRSWCNYELVYVVLLLRSEFD